MRCTGLMRCAAPQHVGRVEHHGQRAGDVGACLTAGDHRDGVGAVATSSIAACSKRSSSSPTGSSTRVMPATDWVPGMMHTWSAV